MCSNEDPVQAKINLKKFFKEKEKRNSQSRKKTNNNDNNNKNQMSGAYVLINIIGVSSSFNVCNLGPLS